MSVVSGAQARARAFIRRLPVGAEVIPDGGGVHFRVWAPNCCRVEVVLAEPGSETWPLERESDGYFSGAHAGCGDGTRYWHRLDGQNQLCPDPASRFQPEGPNGPSQVVDPDAFPWTDGGWPGAQLAGQAMYEMHVGTFTQEGTFRAAAERLPALADTGITLIEMMPIADFAGTYGWSYDGVNLFAPTRNYGVPDDLRHFVDRAHAQGVAVILDVVYNHLGAEGNYLPQYSRHYMSTRYKTEWGEALNFDGESSGPVREYVVANACYWLTEFHLDGFRIDATQAFFDSSGDHILAEIVRESRRAAGRPIVILAESEPQQTILVKSPQRGGYGMDGAWNDDFHHSATVALTGHNEAYYTDYLGSPEEFVAELKWGYLYQGQRYKWQAKPRGKPTFGLPAATFVNYLQNHDQLANSGRGDRIDKLTSPGKLRAMTALLLLGPGTPLLFQGQEFGAATPFLYFNDCGRALADKVREGRAEFVAQFPSLATPEIQARLPIPCDADSYLKCKLDWSERERNKRSLDLHRDLLRLRRDDEVIRRQDAERLHGARLAEQAFVIRQFDDEGGDRLLIFNFGRDLRLDPCPQPLMAPPEGRRWGLIWSSEAVEYGGMGTPEFERDGVWHVMGESAVVFRAITAQRQASAT